MIPALIPLNKNKSDLKVGCGFFVCLGFVITTMVVNLCLIRVTLGHVTTVCGFIRATVMHWLICCKSLYHLLVIVSSQGQVHAKKSIQELSNIMLLHILNLHLWFLS